MTAKLDQELLHQELLDQQLQYWIKNCCRFTGPYSIYSVVLGLLHSYCAVLCCTVPGRAAVYSTTLYCAIPYYTALPRLLTVLYFVVCAFQHFSSATPSHVSSSLHQQLSFLLSLFRLLCIRLTLSLSSASALSQLCLSSTCSALIYTPLQVPRTAGHHPHHPRSHAHSHPHAIAPSAYSG